MLQNFAAQDNEPMPNANDVYSDFDGKLNTIISKKKKRIAQQIVTYS